MRYYNTSLLGGLLWLRFLLQVQLAHDPVKGVVRLVRAKFAGGLLEAVMLAIHNFTHDPSTPFFATMLLKPLIRIRFFRVTRINADST